MLGAEVGASEQHILGVEGNRAASAIIDVAEPQWPTIQDALVRWGFLPMR
jgi:hypothetical protein